MKFPYKNFDNYVLRTPILSFDSFKELTSQKTVSNAQLKQACSEPLIREAFFLASPDLMQEVDRFINDEIKDERKITRIRQSILKYLTRMSTRCTPFGLFAGCSVGKFSNNTDIKLKHPSENNRHTRLDMNYLVALSQNLVKNTAIRDQLLFYPNTSIYRVGDQLRYIEYKYKNGKREHEIVAVDDSVYLEKILIGASHGAGITNLAKLIVDEEIEMSDAFNFIEELILNQLLISELEPTVSGPEFSNQIFTVLDKLQGVDHILSILNKVNHKIKNLDKSIGNEIQEYKEISYLLKEIGTEFDPKYLFQTDMILNCETNVIDEALIQNMEKAFTILNKITLPAQNQLLSKFQDAFLERYEKSDISLAKVLDVEVGLGYPVGQGSKDLNPLIDDIVIPSLSKSNGEMDLKWNSINSLFQRKLIHAIRGNEYLVSLKDVDFKDYDLSWSDFPGTMSFIAEIVNLEGVKKIKLNIGGGSSAANLLGRFCHGDMDILNYVKEIIKTEDEIEKNKILAEIVHLPESRVGNILMRPSFRKYEIPYLAKSTKPENNQLYIDDLLISNKIDNKITLWSKKHNKQVVPRLTNAHNYRANSLPIYHFLSDMQTKGMRGGVGFDFGPFANEYEFLPRVEYENIILHKATWNLKKYHIKTLIENRDKDEALLESLEEFRSFWKIPQFAMLAEGDNQLLINFKNLSSVRIFLDSFKTKIKLVEFIFTEEGIVKMNGESYTNQIVVSFYNQQRLNDQN